MKTLLSAALLVFASFLAACGPRPATITAEALHARLQSSDRKPLVVDVREPHEFRQGHIDGATLAPLRDVVDALEGTDKNREIVLVCRSGNRSGKAQKLLAERGYMQLRNMEGGMVDWEKRGFPVTKP